MKFITGKQFNDLISLPDTVVRNDLKISQDNRDFYLLQDGRLLAFSDSIPNKVQMFESVEEYNSIIAIVLSEVEEGDFLEKYISVLSQIPGNIESCKESLSKQLGISPDLLDYSPKSIRLIDKKIRKAVSRHEYFDKVYGYLFVYFGETVRKELNGEWSVRILDGVGEPFVLSENKKRIFFSKELHEQASEDFKNFSIYREFKVVTNI
jgi:hypothetical protein